MSRLTAACFTILALLGFALSGCSSVVKGPLEDVRITTPGVAGARCIVRNDLFLYILNPPRTFQLEKTDQAYTVTCFAPGNRRKTIVVPSGYEKTTNLNLVNGYIPGAAVDLMTGSIFHYPAQIIVDFTDSKPEPMPLPDYQLMLQQNPLIKGMEQFRPGNSALQTDENENIVPMQKRPPGSYDDSFDVPASSPATSSAGNGTRATGFAPAATTTTVVSTPVSTVTPAATTTTSTSTSARSGLMHGLPAWSSSGTGAATGTTSTTTTTTVTNGSGFAGGTAAATGANGSPTSLSH